MKTKTKMTKPWNTVQITLNTGEQVCVMFDGLDRASKFFQDVRSSGRFMDSWVRECSLITGDGRAKLD